MEFITDKIRMNIYNRIINRDNMSSFFYGDEIDYNFEVLLIDYYNVLKFKEEVGDITPHDLNDLNLINKYTVQELKILINDLTFIKKLLSSTMSFHELARLDKQQIVKIAYNSKNKNDLTSRALFNINYMSNLPSYDLHQLIDYYIEYIRINGKDVDNHEEGCNIIMGYLSELKLSDENKYDEILLYAMSYYYKLITYLKRDCKKDIYRQNLIFAKKIELYDVKMLLKCIKKDNDLLYEVIKQCLFYKTLSKPLTDDIDEYLDKKISKKTKRKLNHLSDNK